MIPRHLPFWKFNTVDPTWPWFTRSCLKSHEWTVAKLGTTVHDNIFEVLIAESLSYLYSWLPTVLFYLHRGTSHIGSCWHVFSGWAALGLSFRECKRRNDQICPFSSEDNVFINPWFQTTLFQIIAVAATVTVVIWQFAGWTSPIPLLLIISMSTDHMPPLLTKYGVYNADKYFSRNKQLCQLWIIMVWGRIYPTKLRFPNIAHDLRCLKTSQNTSIADPAAIMRWPLYTRLISWTPKTAL